MNVFHPIEFYKSNCEYQFLPFRFRRLNGSRYLLTNIVGEFIFLDANDFCKFRKRELSNKSEIYRDLRAKGFLIDEHSAHLDILASRLWTKKSIIKGFTKLHIFVLTLRCNCSCTYCQVTRQDEDSGDSYDMSIETARKSVELMMQSPSDDITIEFQGGEPLLNYPVLKEIVYYAKKLNSSVGKNLSFVVCTNLSRLDDEMLAFFEKEKVSISTSLDGPEDLHNRNRCRNVRTATYDVVTRNIRKAQEALGRQSVSALMTTTRDSLPYAKQIVDEYLHLDLGSMFVRALNPYGYAVKTRKAIGYSVEDFVNFYKNVLDYILKVNKSGRFFSEAYSTLLLRKILTPWPVGFVDLQSPTGNGFAVTVYNYDGDVYASDESRMLAEMGDSKFRLGSVHYDSYKDIYFSKTIQCLAGNGIAECLAGCSDCVFVPYCGADPVRHYATQHDEYGNRALSDFCKKHKMIFEHIFGFLKEGNEEIEEIFWSWIQERSLEQIHVDREN
ncbi:MAG: His-Xaa-Ser system radical SAM maturase HxsB [Sutterella sp.]|nr:His-Xaa-Ser system radical SAM maturase HxsB [Sutterella sp.]